MYRSLVFALVISFGAGLLACSDDDDTNNEICDNLQDDDGDGLTDCADSDCAVEAYCEPTETICDDNFDNDGDGSIDCDDSGCDGSPACLPDTETVCDDEQDDDGDGDTDCADSDCAAETYCEATETTCDDDFDNDGDGDADCDDSDCIGTAHCQALPETNCNDGLDNDSDGSADCADTDCESQTYCEFPEATCDDQFDNDGDGDADCADSDCAAETYCEATETTCDDQFDNDGDGDVDCDDSDCIGTAQCTTLPETNCNDGQDNDSDGVADCADSDCASETYCEATETTCDDLFDNDGDGDADCADSDCDAAASCQASHGVGAPCLTSADCEDQDAVCMVELGVGMPGGYCTVLYCDGTPTLCPTGSSCLDFGGGYSLCVQDCTLGGTDCRDAYACVSMGVVDACWPDCTQDVQCAQTGDCDPGDGFCVWADLETLDATVTGDGNANHMADPGETFDLSFYVLNVGTGPAAGPISASVVVNTTTSTVTGAVTLTPPGNTVCSATDLAADQSAACPAWGVTIPGTAQPGERLDLTVTFSNGTDTWVDVISLTLGSLYASLLGAPDPLGDSGTFGCDLQDLQGYVSAGTLYLRLVFHAACAIDGWYDIWLTDGNNYIFFSLMDNAGTMTAFIVNYNSGNPVILTPPASYQVSPTTGSSQTVSYEISIADIPVLNTSGNMLWLWTSVGAASSTSSDDDAPDVDVASISW